MAGAEGFRFINFHFDSCGIRVIVVPWFMVLEGFCWICCECLKIVFI